MRDVRQFLAVAKELDFTRAAETLYISQPTLQRLPDSVDRAFAAPATKGAARVDKAPAPVRS